MALCFREGLSLVLAAGIFLWLPGSLPAAPPAEAQKVRLQKESPDAPERVELAKVQVFLDRALFRPGKIDGLGGEFTQKAADRYCRANNLPPGTRLDVSGIITPFRDYTVTEEDGRWVGPQAAKPPAQEKLKAMLYGSLWEVVAERFHCDLNFLKELNPAVKDADLKPGAVLRVPDVEEFVMAEVKALEKQRREEEKARKEAEKAEASPTPEPTPAPEPEPAPPEPSLRLVLLRAERLIEVYEGNQLVACLPCTPGSRKTPVPPGSWKVTANVLMPYFRWDKSVLETGERSDTSYNLPPGPNNPVGIVWMAINRPSVGMHGTATPDMIGRNESAGCIRLANWDAFALSKRVKKGTPLEVQ